MSTEGSDKRMKRRGVQANCYTKKGCRAYYTHHDGFAVNLVVYPLFAAIASTMGVLALGLPLMMNFGFLIEPAFRGPLLDQNGLRLQNIWWILPWFVNIPLVLPVSYILLREYWTSPRWTGGGFGPNCKDNCHLLIIYCLLLLIRVFLAFFTVAAALSPLACVGLGAYALTNY
jgi:hypothetical protein